MTALDPQLQHKGLAMTYSNECAQLRFDDVYIRMDTL